MLIVFVIGLFQIDFSKLFPEPKPPRIVRELERTFVGSPPMNDSIEIDGKPIFSNHFIVETTEPISEENAALLETAVDGTFCGGSAYTANTYFLCLNLSGHEAEEYLKKLKILEQFDFITGVGSSSAQLASYN